MAIKRSQGSTFLRRLSHLLCLLASWAQLGCLLIPVRLSAQTSTWISPTNGNWSAAGNWDVPPVGGATTILNFNAAGSQAYTATNDLADPFLLNRIVLNSTSTGTLTVGGAKLRFVGGAAKIRQDGSGAFLFDAPLEFDEPLTLEGSGTGFVTFNGALAGMGGLIKTGSSTFVFGTPGPNVGSNNTFAGGLTIDDGTIRFADPQYSGPTALRSNRIRYSAGAGSLIYGSSDFLTATELRVGELVGTAGALFQARSTSGNSERGQNVVITLLGNGDYGGTFTNTGTGLTDGTLKLRGIGNQTFTGTFNVNSDIEVFHGTVLTLANSASLAGTTGGRLYLNGGTIVFDARAMTGSNLIRDGSASAGGIDGGGGGTFRFIGKAAGSSESVGRLALSDSSVFRAGATRIELVHTATSAATVLTFAAIDRHQSTSIHSTIDFAAFDGAGTTLTLGQTGSNPRIVLSSGVFLINSLLSRTVSSGVAAISGYATVNGTDFATHNATNGIGPVTTTLWTGSSSASTNFRMTADGDTGGAASTFAASSLKLDSSAGSLTFDISGSGNFQTNGILLAGSNDAAITSTGGGGWIGFGNRYAHVQSATLTIDASVANSNALVKAGGGTLVLTNSANSAGTGILTINEGLVRAGAATLLGGALELRGGVLEITGGGTFNRAIGTGANSVNWSGSTTFDRGSGGFAAFGAPVVVDLKNIGIDDIWWRDANFLEEGYALVFGSKTADARLTFLDRLNLSENSAPAIQAYNTREIQVVDNPSSSADFARLAGVIDGDTTEDLLKTGSGVLELSAANTYLGGTVVAEGTLLLADSSALGAANAAYVLLGLRSGAADVALLTSHPTGTITIPRDLLVQTGGSGSATIGNTLAPDSATTADALFSGDILVGLQGDTLAKNVKLTAVAGTSVTFSGAISTHSGYGGTVAMEKIGGGDLYLTGTASYSGATTISAGQYIVSSGGRLSGSGGIVVAPGTVFKIATGGQVTGSGQINVTGSAPIDNIAVNKGTVIVDGMAGTSNASIVVGQGGLLQGNNGVVNGSVTIQRGGAIGPGNSVGTLNVTGPAPSTWEAGSHVYFEFLFAGGDTPGRDWDYLNFLTSRLQINGTSADPIMLHVDSWVPGNTGHGANDFDTSASYHWLFADTGGLDLASSSGTFADRFRIIDDTLGAGVFGDGNPEIRTEGSFYVTMVGDDLYLNYAAVPEPGSTTLIVVATAGMVWYRRRCAARASVPASVIDQAS